MIKAEALVEKFRYPLDNGWGYFWGASGYLWTKAKQQQKEDYMKSHYGTDWKHNSEAKGDRYYWSTYYGAKWIGHYVIDCSGMFVWAYKAFGASIAHGSNSIWNKYCSRKGELVKGLKTDGSELIPGTAVFVYKKDQDNRSHIGLYVGGGKVIEAAGCPEGVIMSDVTNKKWNEWGELKAVDYSDSGFPDVPTWRPTIRRGSKGQDVVDMQTMLYKLGYDIGVAGIDGDFGRGTEQAVKAFQSDHKLGVDGVCGPLTWDELQKAYDKQEEEPVEKQYTVCIHHLDKTQAEALKNAYPGSVITEE